MLVEFKVRNFRSIKDEQVLSLVATSDKNLAETNACNTGIAAVPRVLRSAVVYGANASGKSNLIMALQFMRSMVMHSVRTKPEGMDFGVKPFLLERKSSSSPTSFEAMILLDGVRYEYGFSMTPKRIISEQLLVYKNFKPQQWFKRTYNKKTGKDEFVFKTGLRGAKNVWQSATRPDSLFLSVAMHLNSEDVKPICDWFASQCEVIPDLVDLSPMYTAKLIESDGKEKAVRDFLASADTGISGIKVTKEKMPSPGYNVDLLTGETKAVSREREVPKVIFNHAGVDTGEVAFNFVDESSGTRRLFAYAGPLLNILENGKTLVVDELDTSLHPLLLTRLVKLFHDPATNTGNAQLIFSTHDATLLRAYGLFRRDQIWFTDKGADQATTLTSLAEFKTRKTENIERYYLDGRYGGTPFFDTDMTLSG